MSTPTSYNAEKQQWHEKNRQHLTKFATHLAFSAETLLDLSTHGLCPIASLTTATHPLRVLETVIPLLCGKILQWQVTWEDVSGIKQIFLKLGTGDRINRCQLILSVFRQQSNLREPLATAQVLGTTVQDNQWTAFIFTEPLPAGNYLCQLISPDADNACNTLFIWLTVAGLNNYCYFPTRLEKSPVFKQQPLISFLVVLPEKREESLWQACLEGIQGQSYPYWQLCVVGEQMNAYNKALAQAKGEYVAILPTNDILSRDALVQIVDWLNSATEPVDMLYSDEDKVNLGNIYYDPFFKPDWAMDMLRGQFYTGQLAIYRTRLLKEIGGFRDCAHPLWDMVLRFTERTSHIQHIPTILYHRRQSTLDIPIQNAMTVVQTALDREQQGGTVTVHDSISLVHYPVQGQPLVSIIMPTRDRAEMLAQCLESLCQITTYPHWEIILIDNGSRETATFTVFSQYQQRLKNALTISRFDKPFNFSQLVNHGVSLARGEFILLLNNDMRVVAPENWLQEMLGFAQQERIAGVSCKLLYPQDNTIQHAGLICGIGGIANPGHKYFPANSRGYFNRLNMIVNCSAVTGACMLVKRTRWEQVNGFDENLAVAFNDVDFCLKLRKLGYQHLVLPHVIFYHEESKSRGLENTTMKQERLQKEQDYMLQRWGNVLLSDPFYNLHLTKRAEDFSLSHDSVYYCGHYLLV